MILWNELENIKQIPKDGTRFIVTNFGRTLASKEDNKPYIIWGLFETDIVQYCWDTEEKRDECYISSKEKIVPSSYILSQYTHFSIINQPERSKREDSQKDN
jgi:hypothetical protein